MGKYFGKCPYTKFMGGEELDDHNELRSQMENHPNLEIASPDTIEYRFQKLKHETQKKGAKNDCTPYGNTRDGFKKLLPKM